MARKSTPQGGAVDPTLSSEKAIELIERQIERADEILNLPYTDPKVNAWKNTTVNILEAAFGLPNGTPHRNSTEFNYASSGISGPSVYGRDSTAAFQHSHQLLTQKRKALLQGFVEQLRDLSPVAEVASDPTSAELSHSASETDVFVVHGHDEAAREAVSRFIEKLGLRAIILHEQANEGKTVIEKFEKHSDVGFAVVLLTPDDVGFAKADSEKRRPRARQNVIFELGYFVGRLGRGRVCALHKGSVEIPSDYQGIVYVPMDDGGAWRLQLAKELKQAKFAVDLNKAI